jgi:hypothetical protein
MGALLTTASTLQCPHGGTVTLVTANATTQVSGAFAITAADTLTIAGCPFTIPPGTPHPCTTVQWVSTDTKSTIGGNATLSEESVGLCLAADQAPQGPVMITAGQSAVSGL